MSAGRLALLQLCDSLFPVGSFAHSDGLESAVAAGHVNGSADLRIWLDGQLHLALEQTDGAAVRIASLAFGVGDLDALAAVDDELHALRPSRAGREATCAQGARLLKTWLHVHPSERLERTVAARASHTYPVAFGMVCGSLDLPIEETLEAFFYTRLAATVSAAMRLMPLGQHEAQKILRELLLEVPACAARVAAADDPPCSFAPRMDIATMQQQYVHSRLFRS